MYCLAELERYEKALKYIDIALELNPDFEPAKEFKKLIKAIN